MRDNIQLQITGIRQVAILSYMPTENSAQQIITAVYEEYIAHQNETLGGSGRDLVEFMSIYLNAKTEQRDQVQAELEAYLLAHPEDPSFERREIEQTQISLLTTFLDDLVGDIDYTKDVLDLGFLLEDTSDRYFRETFLLLDDPFQPISMTSLTKKASNTAQGVAVGIVLSILILGLFVVFDRRITLPIDLYNITTLPILTMVPMEHVSQKQRYNIRERRKSLSRTLQQWFRERATQPEIQLQPPSRRSQGYVKRDLNSFKR